MNPLDLRNSSGNSPDNAADEQQPINEPISFETTTQNLQNVRNRLFNLVRRFWELDVALRSLRELWGRDQGGEPLSTGRAMDQMSSSYQLSTSLRKLPTIPKENEDEINEGDS